MSSDVFTFYPGSHQYQVLCPSSSQSNVHHHPRSSLPLSWKPLDPIWTTRSSAFQHTMKWLLWNLNLNTRWQILQLNRLNTTIQSWTKNFYHSCSFFQKPWHLTHWYTQPLVKMVPCQKAVHGSCLVAPPDVAASVAVPVTSCRRPCELCATDSRHRGPWWQKTRDQCL